MKSGVLPVLYAVFHFIAVNLGKFSAHLPAKIICRLGLKTRTDVAKNSRWDSRIDEKQEITGKMIK